MNNFKCVLKVLTIFHYNSQIFAIDTKHFVNNIDLFMLLKDKLKSFTDSNKFCDHLKQELGLQLNGENTVIFTKFCQKYTSKMKKKWIAANRTFANFLKNNENWLEAPIVWPAFFASEGEQIDIIDAESSVNVEHLPGCVDNLPPSIHGASTSLTPNKPFEELSSRQKRRRIQILSDSLSPEELTKSTVRTLKDSGKEDVSRILDHLLKHPEDIHKVQSSLSRKKVMSNLLPEISDLQNIQTKIIFSDEKDNPPADTNNLHNINVLNIKTEVKTEPIPDTEENTSENSTHTTEDVAQLNFPSDLFEDIKRNSDKTNATQQNNYDMKNQLDDANNKKRKHSVVIKTTETFNEENSNNTFSNVPKKRICARSDSEIKETQPPKQTSSDGSQCINGFHTDVIQPQPVHSDENPETGFPKPPGSVISQNREANVSQSSNINPFKTMADRIVSLGYQLQMLAKTNLKNDNNYRIQFTNKVTDCFKSLYFITMQYILPKKHDEVFSNKLIKYITTVAIERNIKMSTYPVRMILYRLIIWTEEVNKKVKVQYFTDYLTGDLANVLLNNTNSELSEKPMDYPSSTKDQEGQPHFNSKITHNRENNIWNPSTGSNMPAVNTVINTIQNNSQDRYETVIKCNIIQGNNQPSNAAQEKNPILTQILKEPYYLQTQSQNVMTNATLGQNTFGQHLVYNNSPAHIPQFSTEYSEQSPLNVRNQMINAHNIYQKKCQQPPPPYTENNRADAPNFNQRQLQQPSFYQNHNIVISPINNQQPIRPSTSYQNQYLNNPNSIHQNNHQKNTQQNAQNHQHPVNQNQMPYSMNNMSQQNQQRHLYQNHNMLNVIYPNKQVINQHNIQAYGQIQELPPKNIQFTHHSDALPSQNILPAASSGCNVLENFDISLLDLKSSNTTCDVLKSLSPLSYGVNNNVASSPQTSLHPERSISRDSGFISPPADNLETFAPTITHVTSLNKNVEYIKTGLCFVCKRSTKFMCLGCHKNYYCSTTCQHIDWKSHRLECKPTTDK